MKQVELLNAEVKRMDKESKAKMDDAMKRIALLEKNKAGTESMTDIEEEKSNTSTGNTEERKRKRSELPPTIMEISLLKKNNAVMESGFDKLEKEAEKSRGKLDDAMKRVALLEENHAGTESTIDIVEENSNTSTGNTEDTKRTALLEKNHARTEGTIDIVEENSNTSTGNTEDTKLLCPVKYDNKCFLPVTKRYVNYAGAVGTCKRHGGQLANIYSQTHMDDVMQYIRENGMGDSISPQFHLGMKYHPKAKKFTLRDGTVAPAGLKWRPGAPYITAGWTNVILLVSSDQYLVSQYLLNYSPSIKSYVLCEIE